LIISSTPANTTMVMLVSGFVAGIRSCTIIFDKSHLLGRIVSPEHAALEAKSAITFRQTSRRLTYFKLCCAAVATSFDSHDLKSSSSFSVYGLDSLMRTWTLQTLSSPRPSPIFPRSTGSDDPASDASQAYHA